MGAGTVAVTDDERRVLDRMALTAMRLLS